MQKKLEKWGYSFANRYIGDFLGGLKQNPQLLAEILRKPAELIASDLEKQFSKRIPQLAGAGVAGQIGSAGGLQALLPMFGVSKKHAALLDFGARLLGGNKLLEGVEGNASSTSPFDNVR